VEDRSSKTPVVVEVSTEVEDRRARDPPEAMTEVVCGMMKAVPVVKALVTIFSPIPVVKPE